MNRSLIFISCFFLTVITSCSKLSSTDDATTASTVLGKINSTDVAPVTSLVVPDNAADAKKYGAFGDGVHDDTESLQKLINTQTDILLPAGTYLISKTLNFRSNVKIYGVAGATIASSKNISGTLQTNGRFIYLYQADNCLIYNVTFKSNGSAFSFSDWSNACIYVAASKGTNILYNTFNFELKYGKSGMEAVWFAGARTENSTIKGNKLYTVGIEYAEAGASACLVDSNYIKNAHSVAIDGHGNNDNYITGVVISNNIVEYPGYIGIEDWGNTSGTIIKNNTVSHTGQDPSQGKDAMGISAVGLKPQVLHNVITDAYLYYIELSGSSEKLIDGNIINDTRGEATGITVNYNYSLSIRDNSTNTNNRVVITNNQINNCGIGVSYYGNNNINTEFRSNNIVDPKIGAVSIDSDAPMLAADITDNKITFTSPAVSKQTRYGFQAYTRLLPSNPAKHSINYANNTIEYTSTANSSAPDCAFGIAANNTTINNNIIKSAISNLLAIHNDNNDILNLYLTKNAFSGVKNDLSRFNLLANSGNVITK